MNKKEFLIKVLELIGDSWQLGNALLILLKNDELNDEQISKLVRIMEDSLKSIEDEQDRERIRKGIQLLKDREQNDQKNMEKDLQAIENLLDDI